MIASFDARDRDRSEFRLARLGWGIGPGGRRMWNLALLAILGLLVTIAVLQYRWIKQINDDTEDRARNSMETAMTQWNREFYRGLYSICGGLLADPDAASLEGWTEYLQRYSTWRHEEYHYNPANALRPGASLISDVYIWETASGAAPELFLLDPVHHRIGPAARPAQLEPLLARLRDRSQTYDAALHAWQLPGQEISRPPTNPTAASAAQQDPQYTGWQIDQTLLALVHPLVHHARPMAHSNLPTPEQGPVDWMVIVLNRETIQGAILPQLAKRNFSSRRTLDYRVAIVAPGTKRSVIYTSEPGFPQEDTHGATMRIFGHPGHPTETNGPPPQSSDAWSTGDDSAHLSGPGWQWFPVIQYGSGTAPWMLVVQRRSGSIDAAVNRVWRTNMVTALAVLLLLAGSVGLLVVATRRAQYLAHLQMNFVTSVSHELRTPLTVMISAAENIADGVVEKPLEVREHGRIIVGHGRALSDLVNRILLFAAGNSGNGAGHRQPVDVGDAVNGLLFNLAEPIQSAGIHVERNISPNLPCVLADPDVLCQCLQNLVVNAIKYRGHSKWITISAEVGESTPSVPEVRISVQDRGIGIHESELKSIFEPFYRSPDVVARHIQGTGLGLPMVKRSVLEMGGRLMVTSTLGSGSTFTIILPVAPPQAHQTPVPAAKDTGVPVV